MRRGKALVAAALAAAVLPLPSAQADTLHLQPQLVREVRFDGKVSYSPPAGGATRRGTITFALRSFQGLEATGKGNSDTAGDPEFDPYLGAGPQQAGLLRYEACMTLIIKDVINEKNHCDLLDATLAMDPTLEDASITASLMHNEDWVISVNARVEGVGDIANEPPSQRVDPVFTPATDECVAGSEQYTVSAQRYVESRGGATDYDDVDLSCVTGGTDAVLGAFVGRPGIMIVGNIYHQDPKIGLIPFLVNEFQVTMRQGIDLITAQERGPVVCYHPQGPPSPPLFPGCYV